MASPELGKLTMVELSRRQFLRLGGGAAAGVALIPFSDLIDWADSIPPLPDVKVIGIDKPVATIQELLTLHGNLTPGPLQDLIHLYPGITTEEIVAARQQNLSGAHLFYDTVVPKTIWDANLPAKLALATYDLQTILSRDVWWLTKYIVPRRIWIVEDQLIDVLDLTRKLTAARDRRDDNPWLKILDIDAALILKPDEAAIWKKGNPNQLARAFSHRILPQFFNLLPLSPYAIHLKDGHHSLRNPILAYEGDVMRKPDDTEPLQMSHPTAVQIGVSANDCGIRSAWWEDLPAYRREPQIASYKFQAPKGIRIEAFECVGQNNIAVLKDSNEYATLPVQLVPGYSVSGNELTLTGEALEASSPYLLALLHIDDDPNTIYLPLPFLLAHLETRLGRTPSLNIRVYPALRTPGEQIEMDFIQDASFQEYLASHPEVIASCPLAGTDLIHVWKWQREESKIMTLFKDERFQVILWFLGMAGLLASPLILEKIDQRRTRSFSFSF